MKRLLPLLLLTLVPACAPLSVTFTLGARERPLQETPVIDDPEANVKVALIDVRGTIVDAPRPGLFGSGGNPVDEFLARLRLAEQDSTVRAVVIRINSPGGSVTASDILYSEVRRFAETTKKPVVASLGEVAASGGYYLALACDEIVTQPTTITASIGVIIPTINVSDGLRRIGIVARSIKSGENKDLANPLEPIREGQYAVLQEMVDEFYGRFRGLVMERRPDLDTGRIDELTDGRVVTGAQAVEAGLADHEGDLRDSFERAKALAGVSHARLIKYHEDFAKPRSAYSPEASVEPHRAGGASEVNLVQIELGDALLGAGGTNAYYLWAPGLR